MTLILIGFLLIIGIVLSIYRSFYWRLRNIPGPISWPLIGALHHFNRKGQSNVLLLSEWTRKYGKKIYGFQRGWRNFLVISDPKLVQEIMQKFEYFHERETIPIRGNVDLESCVHLFHSRGHRWQRQRQLSTKVYSLDYLKKILPHLDNCIKTTIGNLKKEAVENKEFNVHPYFFELTMDLITTVILGPNHQYKQFENPMSRIIFDLLNEVDSPIFTLSWMFPYFGRLFARLRLICGKHKRSGLFELIYQSYSIVNKRKQERNVEKSNDESLSLLDHFLNHECKNVPMIETGVYKPLKNVTFNNYQKTLTLDEIAAQCCAFFIAGFGTSSSTLSLIAFYLAKHPEIQEKLREEIQMISLNETPTYQDLNSLKLLDAVVKETLRLHPVGTFAFGRRCSYTTTIDSNLTIDKGTHVLFDVISMHRDPDIWGQDAGEFNPKRWLDKDLSQAAYYPFGAGPRVCVGRRLAMLEIKLVVVRIMQNFRILKMSKTENEPKLIGNLILIPKEVQIRLINLSQSDFVFI